MNDLDKAAEIADTVKRDSRQPRMDRDTARNFFGSVYKFAKKAERDEPAYIPDSRVRDSWLRKFVHNEQFLLGVLNKVISLDVNRTFEVVGGRNQTIRVYNRLTNSQWGRGWRYLKMLTARDYYNTDMGAITELETDGQNGPLVSLYHVDSARCRLTGNPEWPLAYYPQKGKKQLWRDDWFYRITSMPNPAEDYNELGYCAISRCVKMAQIMIAIVEYDLEKLGHLAPRGILFIESENLTQEAWNEAAEVRKQITVGKTGNEYFDNIMVLVDEAIKGDLLALSKLPDNFDQMEFMDAMMKGYALSFGRDAGLFWNVDRGNFGGDGEAQIQYERATRAGGLDYAVSDQEQLQKHLPDSVLFQYEQDDTRGKILKAELADKLTIVGERLVNIGASQTNVLGWLADQGVIDKDWTLEEEDVIATSDGVIRDRLLESDHIHRAIDLYPDQPIIRKVWPDNREEVVWERARHAIPKGFIINKPYTSQGTASRQRSRRKIVETAKLETLIQNRPKVITPDFVDTFLNEVQRLMYAQIVCHASGFSKLNLSEEDYKVYTGEKQLDVPLHVRIAIDDELQKVETFLYGLYTENFNDSPQDSLVRQLSYINEQISWIGLVASINKESTYKWVAKDDSCRDREGLTMTGTKWLESSELPMMPGNRCLCELREVIEEEE